MGPHYIIIPAYNEQASIGAVIASVKETNPRAGIVVVNDGSTDNTSDIAKETGAMVIDIPFNIGYGGAIQTGFRFVLDRDCDFVITIDGDGQHDPSSAQALIETMEREGADVVIGSRFLGGSYSMSIPRKIGVWLFSAIARLYTGVRFSDPTSGFQLINRRVFSHLAQGENYALDYPDVNIIMALHKMRFKVVETPVRMLEKTGGKSMHSGLRPIIYVIRMFLAILMVILRKEEYP